MPRKPFGRVFDQGQLDLLQLDLVRADLGLLDLELLDLRRLDLELLDLEQPGQYTINVSNKASGCLKPHIRCSTLHQQRIYFS